VARTNGGPTRASRGAGWSAGKGPGKRTLVVDVGASKIKASVLDAAGELVAGPVRTETPARIGPTELVKIVARLAAELPAYERVSLGFPGIVVDGVVYTAPNLGTERFRGVSLAAKLSARLRRPARVVNDAELHALGAIVGEGVEVVMTLGTGLGMAVFCDGRPGPQFGLTPPPVKKKNGKPRTPEASGVGNAARKRLGNRKWSKQVERVFLLLRDLTEFDRLYVGGGNAKHLELELPGDITLVDNTAAFAGGARVWQRHRLRRRRESD
jgi:polyphosphate glucokinase